jgi:hypothetical protein
MISCMWQADKNCTLGNSFSIWLILWRSISWFSLSVLIQSTCDYRVMKAMNNINQMILMMCLLDANWSIYNDITVCWITLRSILQFSPSVLIWSAWNDHSQKGIKNVYLKIPRASQTIKISVFCVWSSTCLRGILFPLSSFKYQISPSNLKSGQDDVQDGLFHHFSKGFVWRTKWNSQLCLISPFVPCKLNNISQFWRFWLHFFFCILPPILLLPLDISSHDQVVY